jgi:hypothetical protein
MLAVCIVLGAAQQMYAEAVDTKAEKKTVAPLNINGFRIGMTVSEAKQLLQKKKIRGYETGYSDLFVYSPAPGTEIRLVFTCSAKANILGKAELTTSFTTEEAELAVEKFREKLLSRYGMPLFSGAQGDLDFCWGQCQQGSDGVKLTAVTTEQQGNKRTLALTLDNDALIQACSELRPKKINSWLYQWIAAVQKFKLGMSLKDVSALYGKRYQNKLELEEERDEAAQQHVVTNYVAKEYDFFTALDYDSQAFEGIELGTIVLRFTGDQAGKESLNKKLYYASFTTTKFTDLHVYTDVQQKLDQFIKVYGTPAEVVPQPGGTTARWQQDTKQLQRSVSIFDSGMITFEQFDPALKDAYRDAAVKKMDEYNKTRFDRPIF